jgi:hypothetical protein
MDGFDWGWEGTGKTNRGAHGDWKRGGGFEVERAVVRAGWRWDSRTARDCVALPA